MESDGWLGRIWSWILTHPNVVLPLVILAVVVTPPLTVPLSGGRREPRSRRGLGRYDWARHRTR